MRPPWYQHRQWRKNEDEFRSRWLWTKRHRPHGPSGLECPFICRAARGLVDNVHGSRCASRSLDQLLEPRCTGGQEEANIQTGGGCPRLLEVAGGCRRRKSETGGSHLIRHLISCDMSCDYCLCNALSAERQGRQLDSDYNDATASFQQGTLSLQALLLCPLGFLERQACAVEAGQL